MFWSKSLVNWLGFKAPGHLCLNSNFFQGGIRARQKNIPEEIILLDQEGMQEGKWASYVYEDAVLGLSWYLYWIYKD